MDRGWVKLWRKTLESGVMGNPNALSLFVFILLNTTRNRREQVVLNVVHTIEPGESIVATRTTSAKLGLSCQQFRSALLMLETLKIVTRRTTRQCTVVKLVKWDSYQLAEDGSNTPSNTCPTRPQHAPNTPPTQEQEVGNSRSKEGKKKTLVADRHQIPPTLEQVAAYCAERGNRVDPEKWIDHYTSKGWVIGKARMKDWQAAVRTWEKTGFNDLVPIPISVDNHFDLFPLVTPRSKKENPTNEVKNTTEQPGGGTSGTWSLPLEP